MNIFYVPRKDVLDVFVQLFLKTHHQEDLHVCNFLVTGGNRIS